MKKFAALAVITLMAAPLFGVEISNGQPFPATQTAAAVQTVQTVNTTAVAASVTTQAVPQFVTMTAQQGNTITASVLTGVSLTSQATFQLTTVTAQGSTLTAGAGVSLTALPVLPYGVTVTVSDFTMSRINFDTSGINSIKLNWDAAAKANIYYNVYRATAADYAVQNEKKLSKNEFIDSKINSATVYYYKVEATDLSNNAYMSATRQVKSADLFMPNPPQGFKAYQDVQQIVLKWSAAPQTSFPVSGYNIYRGKTEDKQDFVKFLPYTKQSINDDDIDPAVRYYYKLNTVDVKGNESKFTDTASSMAYPPQRTGLVLMPTGYRNNIYDNMGLNVDLGFSYYIGSLYGAHDVQPYGKGTDNISKIGIWLLNLDGKFTIFNEYERWPSLGLGISYTVLMQDSIGGNSDVRSKQATFSVGQSILTLQGIYLSTSKKLPYDNTVHGGFSMGINKRGMAAFLPYLASSFVDSGSSRGADTNLDLRNSYFFGYSRPLFNKMGFRVEYMVPIDVNRSINANPVLPDNYIINTHIDRLFNFDIGYLHYTGGYAWVGYINLRFTVFPSPYK
jgi:hypothetical protein